MKKCLILIILIFSLSLIIFGEDLYYNFNNKLSTYYETNDSIFYFNNEFNLNAGYKGLDFSCIFLTSLPEYDSKNTNNSYDSVLPKNYVFLKKKSLSHSTEGYKIILGNYNNSLGKGLIFSTQNNDPEKELFLEGIFMNYNNQYLSLDIFGGKNVFIYKDVYFIKSKTEFNEINKQDMIRGGTLSFNFLEKKITTGINAAIYDIKRKKTTVFGESFIYTPALVYSGNAEYRQNNYNLYFEYAVKRLYNQKFNGLYRENPAEGAKGKGFFIDFNATFLDKFSIDIQGKSYDKLTIYNKNTLEDDIIYINPPKANYDDENLNEYTRIGYDEKGYGVSTDYKMNDNHLFNTSFAYNFSDNKNSKYYENILKYNYKNNNNFDFSFIIKRKQFKNYFPETDKNDNKLEIIPSIDFNYYFSENFEIKGGCEIKFIDKEIKADSLIQFDKKYNSYKGYLTFILPYDFKIITKYEKTEYKEVYDSKKDWANIEITKEINNQHSFKLFYGSDRGGKDCSSGSCINKVSFEGIKFSFESYF